MTDSPWARHSVGEPAELFQEEWFVDNVLMCPAVMGAVRSLLGPGFGLPILISNHRASCPAPAQGWHHDGDSHYGPEVEILQVRARTAITA